jgi:hypothetical protein
MTGACGNTRVWEQAASLACGNRLHHLRVGTGWMTRADTATHTHTTYWHTRTHNRLDDSGLYWTRGCHDSSENKKWCLIEHGWRALCSKPLHTTTAHNKSTQHAPAFQQTTACCRNNREWACGWSVCGLCVHVIHCPCLIVRVIPPFCVRLWWVLRRLREARRMVQCGQEQDARRRVHCGWQDEKVARAAEQPEIRRLPGSFSVPFQFLPLVPVAEGMRVFESVKVFST